jgi:hypothetical protein
VGVLSFLLASLHLTLKLLAVIDPLSAQCTQNTAAVVPTITAAPVASTAASGAAVEAAAEHNGLESNSARKQAARRAAASP